MGGVLTHVSVALIGCLIILLISKKWKLGAVFAIGQLAPDSIRFGLTGLFDEKFTFGEIVQDSLFWKLAFTHYLITWIVVFLVIAGIIFVLHKKKKIKKEKFKEWIIADAIFLLAIIIHLIIDALIIEKSFWI
jgi:heme/copper-type cytochrome/quinol oxidase subunit 1